MFINNTGEIQGGAVYARAANITFSNSCFVSNTGSAIHLTTSNITFTGITLMAGNFGKDSGGAISAVSSTIILKNDTTFDSNNSTRGGALYCLQGEVKFYGHALFYHNLADENGGALYAIGTQIQMLGSHVNFTLNMAQNGGAMYLETGASIMMATTPKKPFLLPTLNYVHTKLAFMNNSAHQYGGGIYHVDSPSSIQCQEVHDLNLEKYLELPNCFIQPRPFRSTTLGKRSIKVHSQNDLAGVSGNFLYGGLLGQCRVGPNNRNEYDTFSQLGVLSDIKAILFVHLPQLHR